MFFSSSTGAPPIAVLLLGSFALAGCNTINSVEDLQAAVPNAAYLAMYDAETDEKFSIPASDISRIDERFLRTVVSYATEERPGTIVIDTRNRHLYLTMENGQAVRYGIGVGGVGMSWSGRAQVGRKAEWPRWTPTSAMIRRDPERNRPWANGMPPGLSNPLGPRALYLHQGGRDTLYRIHGTNEPHTIGQAVSSGCIRMLNQDIIDLYGRVPAGAQVVVLPDRPDPKTEVPVANSRAGSVG